MIKINFKFAIWYKYEKLLFSLGTQPGRTITVWPSTTILLCMIYTQRHVPRTPSKSLSFLCMQRYSICDPVLPSPSLKSITSKPHSQSPRSSDLMVPTPSPVVTLASLDYSSSSMVTYS